VSIKGTLETFNLRELLQMLAFNQKDGTLVLETERGPRTIHLAQGRVGFVAGDRHASNMLARVLRRRGVVADDRVERAEQITSRTGRFLGAVLSEMGSGEAGQLEAAYQEAVAEALFDMQMGKIRRFEFVEGQALAPDGKVGDPIDPRLPVEGLLLELTRKVDTWGVMLETVPSLHEVFEGTGHEVDLSHIEEIDATQAQRVVSHVDGYHDLEQVAESSAVDRYTVLQVAVALLQGGAIRAVPSDDLVARAEDRLARGEASAALPLLRRALERGDAPPRTRVHLADALESMGDAIAAAAELDTFANLSGEGHEVEVFEGLLRALKLREGDPVSAGRVCDHYLRHRSLLKAKRADALDALRTLIHGASAAGRPLDAAQRLAVFLQNNEAPSDDLMVLADLYAAGGDRAEAASALFRRAEDLLVVQRGAAARDCLRRALEHDSSRGDVRRRLQELEGAARRTRHKKRVHLLLTMLGLLTLGGGGAWWFLSRQATQAVTTARDGADDAARTAERSMLELVQKFRSEVQEAESAAEIPEDLSRKARELLASVKALADELRSPISEYAARLEESTGGPTTANETIIRGLEQRRQGLLGKAQSVVGEVKKRAEAMLIEAERANRAGEFVKTRVLLIAARNLGFEDPTVRERAQVLLKHVDTYHERTAKAIAEIDATRERGDLEASARLAFAALAEHLDSDLMHAVRIPVALETTPSGAEVLLGGKPTNLVTPCVLAYGAFEDTTVVLGLPGRTSAVLRLPSYADVQRRSPDLATWSPRLKVNLPEGPRWVLMPGSKQRFLSLWMSGEVPIVLLDDGATTRPVDARDGTLGPAVTTRMANPMRLGGSLPGGVDWRILGHRTLRVKHGPGAAWEAQVLGRLERPPAVEAGVLTVVDEAGTIYGFQLASGTELWRRELGASPAQAPRASPIGFLISTITGAAAAYTPATGEPHNLAAAGRGLTYVVPHGAGALLIGTGPGGLRRVGADGALTALGETSPRPNTLCYAGADGAAWITPQGVTYMATGASAPVLLKGLGANVTHVTGDARGLLAVDATGVLRSTSATDPDKTLWSMDLGGTPDAQPLVVGEAVFILVNGGLTAVER